MGPVPGPRIVLACDFFLRYSTMLAAALERTGAEPVLLTRDHGGEFGGDAGAAEAYVRAALGPRTELRTLSGRVRSPGGWRQALALRRRLSRAGSDVVHLQESIGNDPRLLLAAGVHRGRFAFTVHDPVRHPGDRDTRWTAQSNRALARHAGLVFVHGEAIGDELRARLAVRAPIVVVPHGIEPAEPAPPPPGRSILFFGRISHYKGLDVLLDAMTAVWDALPDVTLTIAGEGSIEPHPVLADNRIAVRAGHVPDRDVPDLIRAAGCVVLPYRQASQSGVGSQVKPFGRPLVASAVGGLPELVADGSGLLVPPEDAGELAAALVRVLGDRELAARLGAAGVATVDRGASWDAVAVRTLDAYREHLGAPV